MLCVLFYRTIHNHFFTLSICLIINRKIKPIWKWMLLAKQHLYRKPCNTYTQESITHNDTMVQHVNYCLKNEKKYTQQIGKTLLKKLSESRKNLFPSCSLNFPAPLLILHVNCCLRKRWSMAFCEKSCNCSGCFIRAYSVCKKNVLCVRGREFTGNYELWIMNYELWIVNCELRKAS